ncbi:putative E3 ubiquitin-protein ligase RHA4A [Heracleum sosnowskyi]|uniref:RING-type E3 ubiquitin transferase n=1 Tax=Heracleum sosnowskyi TaxID=360622 RepID=A0AAD8IIE1_9APIA|nr:putative E3 ubiquitin-protein ligase RHA4A [Heracleum sosnowskyi]
MAFAQSPSTSDIYSQAKGVKQYEAFIILIPILYCIMLFVFIYLFLKKQASAFSLSPTLAETPSFSFAISVCEVGLKEDVADKLPTIVFDEELKGKDSSCCVCLVEFEMKEELIQVPSCKHIFHSVCIRNWLSSTTTCPLCRCSVVVDNAKLLPPSPPSTSPAVLLPGTSVQLAATS